MIIRASWSLIACALLCGCASYKNQLVFGESSDLSIAIHPAPEGGLNFNVGYKQTDIAVVPVAAIDSTGHLEQRSASETGDDKGRRDAVSVFGQFSASSSRSNAAGDQPRRVSFGRFFATGIAAQKLAEGYTDGWTNGVSTQDPAPAAAASDAKPSAEPAKASAGEKPAPDAKATQNVTNNQQPSEILPALVFGQYDMFGLNLGYSGTPGSADFALGYSGRNIAIMPLFGEDSKGFHALGSGADGAKDAFSVVGQFKADTSANAPDVGLDRFFATGMAAQKLSAGLKKRIAASIAKQTRAELGDPAGKDGK